MLFSFRTRTPVLGYRGFLHLLQTVFIYSGLLLLAMPVYSSQSLFTLVSTGNQSIAQSAADLIQQPTTVGQVHFDNLALSNLGQGVVIDVPLPGGKMATGRVITSRKKSASQSAPAALSTSGDAAKRTTIISLDNKAGAVELTLTNNAVTQMRLHDVANEKIYLAQINTSGDGQLQLQDNNDHYCVRFPETTLQQSLAFQAPRVAAQTPDLSVLQSLQSRPGSANVLYLDFWGGTIVDSYWNANYTSNAPINYTPFDTDGNTGIFSDQERYSMWLAWREAIEDFAPFEINITTDPLVYNAAAITSRSRMIITTTRSWYSNTAGGVALVNIFNDDNEYHKTAWTWNLTDSSLGMTISHEAGHQMGLGHDGIDAQSYYIGHGEWGPIMGAPFGKPYVQWSKGEYPGANQFEDDIAKVTSKLGLLNDEAGEGFASATTIDLPVNNSKKLISFGDVDTYKFNLDTAGTVNIRVISLLADEGEARAANLAMNVLLVKLNASGGVQSNISAIDSSDQTPLSPLTNLFDYSGDLDAGTYALRVSPNSPDTNWVTGFGEYANAGEYRLSISATGQGLNTVGRPPIDRAADVGLFIWQNAKNNWASYVVSADQPRIIDYTVTSNLGISNVVPLSIESTDVIAQEPKSLNLKFNVSAPWVDGVKFTINEQSNTCVSMSNTDVPVYLGPDRVLMPSSFDLNTLGPCDLSPVKVLGPPSIDRNADMGIFIWQNAQKSWVVNVVAGDGNGDGSPKVIDVNVTSDQLLSNVETLSIEADDLFTQLPNSLQMNLNVNAPWLDGFRFDAVDPSNTCISTTQKDVPIYLGPQRINVGSNIDLLTHAICD